MNGRRGIAAVLRWQNIFIEILKKTKELIFNYTYSQCIPVSQHY